MGLIMLQVKVTDLRAHLPDFLKKVSNGEQIQITSHGKTIARIIPEIDQVDAAKKRLDALRGTMIVGDILQPLDNEWTADADNL